MKKDNYKVKKEHLKEAIDFIFKQEPREKAQKGEGGYIEVYENENTLSLKVKTEGGISFIAGIRGFCNMLDVEGYWVYKTLPIKYNGVALDDKQTEQFWEKIKKFQERLEKEFNIKEYISLK